MKSLLAVVLRLAGSSVATITVCLAASRLTALLPRFACGFLCFAGSLTAVIFCMVPGKWRIIAVRWFQIESESRNVPAQESAIGLWFSVHSVQFLGMFFIVAVALAVKAGLYVGKDESNSAFGPVGFGGSLFAFAFIFVLGMRVAGSLVFAGKRNFHVFAFGVLSFLLFPFGIWNGIHTLRWLADGHSRRGGFGRNEKRM